MQEATRVPSDVGSIFAAHFGYVRRSLRRLGVRAGDLEDVTHDVFLAVHKRWLDYDGRRPIRPWLFGFALRIASSYRRLSRHRASTTNELGLADGAELPDAQVILRERLDVAMRALDRLPWDYRVIFVLHVMEGAPIPSVADALAIPTNTAYSRLRLARRRFAAAVRSTCRPRGLLPASVSAPRSTEPSLPPRRSARVPNPSRSRNGAGFARSVDSRLATS